MGEQFDESCRAPGLCGTAVRGERACAADFGAMAEGALAEQVIGAVAQNGVDVLTAVFWVNTHHGDGCQVVHPVPGISAMVAFVLEWVVLRAKQRMVRCDGG